jgi:ABC-type branched-subunit amino acid transport system substrate-binding protein
MALEPGEDLMMRSFLICSLAAALMIGAPAKAEPGIASDAIVFGQVAAFEGPAGSLGRDMRSGIIAAFEEANRAGGVKGRKLALISEDDGYDPAKSIAATKRLLAEERVFGLIGAVGTPTSAATQPIAADAGVPFIAPFTGAQFLRESAKKNVVNLRASYFQETETMVERLTKDKGITKIAIVYQDDAFGRAGLKGVQRALEKRSMTPAATASFERNTVAVKVALLTIETSKPEAVILIGPYKPCAEFIKLARRLDVNPVFVNISFVGSNALANELKAEGSGVVVTQVVPFPDDANVPVVAQYNAALHATYPAAKPGFVTLEGYLAGRLVIAALQKEEGEPRRQAFLDTIFSSSFDLGGFELTFSPENNQGSSKVFLTILQPDGAFKPTHDLLSAGSGA